MFPQYSSFFFLAQKHKNIKTLRSSYAYVAAVSSEDMLA